MYLPRTERWAVREREDRSETGEQAEGKKAEPGSKSGGRGVNTTATEAGLGWEADWQSKRTHTGARTGAQSERGCW